MSRRTKVASRTGHGPGPAAVAPRPNTRPSDHERKAPKKGAAWTPPALFRRRRCLREVLPRPNTASGKLNSFAGPAGKAEIGENAIARELGHKAEAVVAGAARRRPSMMRSVQGLPLSPPSPSRPALRSPLAGAFGAQVVHQSFRGRCPSVRAELQRRFCFHGRGPVLTKTEPRSQAPMSMRAPKPGSAR